MFNCPHTGVALAATIKLAQRGEIRRDSTVVVLSTANGLKFTDFKIDCHDNARPGAPNRYTNRPVELPNDYDAVRRTLNRLLPGY
jgi:threonine synthase